MLLYPKVYVIIVNYNGWADTIECLESLLKNDYPNYQIIVVDNSSTDNSIDYIKAWAEGKLDVWVNPHNPLRRFSFPPFPKPIPYIFYTREKAEKGGNHQIEGKAVKNAQKGVNLKYPLIFIQSEENLGFAGGNNIAIKYAVKRSDFSYILLLNNDTVVEKDFLINLLHVAKSQDFDITGCKIYYYNNPQKIWYNGGNFSEWCIRAVHIKKEINYEFSRVNFITGCCMLIKKSVLEEIGLLNDYYFMYVEDLEYCYRAIRNGLKLGVAHTSIIYHKVGTSSGGETSPFSVYWYYRNKVIFTKTNFKGLKRIYLMFVSFIKIPFISLKWLLVKPNILKHMIIGYIKGCHD